MVVWKKIKWSIGISRIFSTVLFLGLISACGQSSSSPSVKVNAAAESPQVAPKIGYRPPNFALQNLEGKTVDLDSFRGKVIFINFWATWCIPCRAEMPLMEKLYQDFKDKDFVMLAVSEDLEGKSVVDPFVKEFKLTFPILLDPDLAVNSLYGIRAIPETFLIDKTGLITHKIPGARDWSQKEMRELVTKLLSLK
jgi:peroxiredoxin